MLTSLRWHRTCPDLWYFVRYSIFSRVFVFVNHDIMIKIFHCNLKYQNSIYHPSLSVGTFCKKKLPLPSSSYKMTKFSNAHLIGNCLSSSCFVASFIYSLHQTTTTTTTWKNVILNKRMVAISFLMVAHSFPRLHSSCIFWADQIFYLHSGAN